MKKLVFTLALMALAASAHGADSPHDVQALIARGDYAGAEALLHQAVAEHPESAKAHYVLAEVLAHEGNIGEARTEANKAASLDPATRFTDPAKFQHFQRELNSALAPGSTPRSAPARAAFGGAPQAAAESAPPSRSGSGFLPILLVVAAVLALIAFLWSRRRNASNGPFAGSAYPPPVNDVPPYAGYQNTGYQNGPGYGYPPPQQHSGVGTAVAAGLGGLAAGALLDEAFRSHRDEEVTREVNPAGFTGSDPTSQAYDELRNDPIDMGNNDSSWNDGGSSDSGDDDDNQW